MFEYAPDTVETISNYTLVFLAFPFFVGVVFFIHELGHYAVARIFDTRIESFSIGMGRKIWQRKDKHDTLWSFSIIPFAGHVIINNNKDNPDSFASKKTWQKLLIIIAGPVSNILGSILILAFSASLIGIPSIPPYVSAVEIGSPADKAGFEPHDRILEFNGKPVVHYREVSDVTEAKTGVPFDFVIERDGNILKLEATSEMVSYKNQDLLTREKGMLGISIAHEGLSLETINEINGINVHDDLDKARDVMKAFLGQNIILNIRFFGDDSKYYYAKTIPEYNKDLFNPESLSYDEVYIGAKKGNFLRKVRPDEALIHAVKETARISHGFLYIFSQIFRGEILVPDIDKITPKNSINHQKEAHQLISIFYLTAMVSILIALFNLLPLPIFDGGQILRVLIGAHRERQKEALSKT